MRKRYLYKCECGKRPLCGTVDGTTEQLRKVCAMLEQAWREDHAGPNFSLKSKTVENAEG